MSDGVPVLGPDEFTQAAAQALAAHPDVEIVGIGELVLQLRVRGRAVTGDLDNYYAVYRGAPTQLAAVLAALVESLTDLPPDRSEDDPAVLLDRVLPMLKPLALLSEVREQGLPLLVYRPLAADLMVTYVVDEGSSVAFLNEEHLRRWGVGEPMLYARALANLRAKPWRPHPGILASGPGALMMFSSGDGYDATRVLIPELFTSFAATLPGRLVIGVPTRDTLLAFSDAEPRIFEQLRAQIAQDAETDAFPLSSELLTYREGVLVAYTPAS